jgi:hypothetical protein
MCEDSDATRTYEVKRRANAVVRRARRNSRSNLNDGNYGVVIEFVSTTTVMRCRGPTITGGNCCADRLEDLQVVWRGRVNSCQLCRAIAVPNPHALQGSHHHTVGSWAVRGASTAPTWQSPRHAGNAAHPRIFLSVNDVHTKVRPVRKIVPPCSWICPGNVRTGDGVGSH